eukprot:CAMPEP_0183429802 /NCGR_PEP_ID=MMETSP0370-20130417/49113_1 /TAXON_ID=268820 /ORGANISM="Peridinium aciculiferum, Strain PAER-2" /LENGTH=129 /DNA_ID=CAMNT_0025614937 /DNA_START=58 /DNA_END=443 /DNA_ORIENTATION=+
MTRLLVASLALLGVPAAAYVVPGVNSAPQLRQRSGALPQLSEMPEVAPETSGFGLAAASVAVGAMLGWFNSRRQQVASVAGAAALAMAPAAGLAIVDYDAVKYLGGSDKVDINNANVQAYRQFPGMYPT